MGVTVGDVATTLRRAITDPAEVQAVEMWIRDAEMKLRLRYPSRERQPDPEAAAMVVREVVAARLLGRADGARVVQVAVDDGSVRREYGASGQSASIDDWWPWLDSTLPTPVSEGAWSIRLSRGLS